MLGFMDYAYPVSVEMALDAMERFARGEKLPAIEQDQAKSRYYSFPSAGDLEVTRRKGIKLVDPIVMKGLFAREFEGAGVEGDLRNVVSTAIGKWYGYLESPSKTEQKLSEIN